MDRLKVFISSTMKELNNERVIVKQALDERDIEAIWFEGFGARPGLPQKEYLAALEQSDVYLGIFWNRHSSATVRELHRAEKLGKPIFVYVKDFDVNRDDGLVRLLRYVEKRYTYKKFKDVLEVKRYVQQDIQSWLIEEWRETRTQLTNLQQKFAKEVKYPSDWGAGGANRLSAYLSQLTSFHRLEEPIRARFDRLIRSLPLDSISFADKEATELVHAMQDSGFEVVGQFSLESGASLIVYCTPGRTSFKDEQEAVLFVNGEVALEDREMLSNFWFMGFENAYFVPRIYDSQLALSFHQKYPADFVLSLEEFEALLRNAGLK